MIVLDTDVLSEALRPRPSVRVLDWLRAEPPAGLFTTTITEAELFCGIALLPESRRRQSLEAVIARILSERFTGRILSFDSAAAREYADIAAARRRAGRPIADAAGRIAAIARSRGAALATRAVDEFAGCDVAVIDPWR